jgi:hypothetical protein
MLGNFRTLLVLSCLLGTSVASAQSGSGAKPSELTENGANSSEVTCTGVAVFSAGGGPEVHVLRRGTLDQRSPLAPLTNLPPAIVLEVTIRGKLAAAHGPSFQEMRRAGPPQELERETGNPIQWEPNLASLPRNILIIGDDKAVVANLGYLKCLPGRRAPSARNDRAKPRASEPPAAAKGQGPAFPVPQGAME